MKKAIAILLSIMLVLAVAIPAAAISSVAVKSIKLDNSKITLKAGETAKLNVTFTPSNTSQTQLTFATDDKNVASVDAAGQITGVGAGTTTITVISSANKAASAKCEVTVTAPEVKTIKVYSWEATLKDQNQAVINAFEKKNPGIKVDMQYPVENDNVAYTKKVDLLLLSGESVDAMFESSVANMAVKADKKLFQPLDSFIAKEGLVYDDVYSVSSKVGNSYYGFPAGIRAWFVMINKSMLDAAGLPIPKLNWTWDDYRAYARKLTHGTGQDKVYGSYFHTFNNYGLFGVYSTKMDNAYYKLPSGELNFLDPNLKYWLKFRYDMENVDKDSVPLIDIKTAKLAYRNEFFGGKVAMVPTGTWMLSEIKDSVKWPHDFQTVFAPLPKWGTAGVEGRTFSDSIMLGIPKSAKNPDEAYKFIRYYTSDGTYIKGTDLPALKKIDLDTMIPLMVGPNPDKLYNMKSLYGVLQNPKFQITAPMYAPSYNAQIDTMFISEMEKYLVGGESLDDSINNMLKQGNDIIKKSK